MLVDGEEILHIVPGLKQDTQDTIVLVARRGSEALSYLPLEHACTAGDALPIVEHSEEDL